MWETLCTHRTAEWIRDSLVKNANETGFKFSQFIRSEGNIVNGRTKYISIYILNCYAPHPGRGSGCIL